MEIPGGLGRTPLGSSNSFLESSVAGTMPRTDINHMGGMELSLNSGNSTPEGLNTLSAENAHLEGLGDDCNVNENQNLLTGFDWVSMDIDGWPNIGSDYLQANLSF
jgi:hypothetical protein